LEAQINLWAHLLAFAVYTGATVLVLMAIPVIGREEDAERRARLAAAVLRIYNPLSIGALGVSVMTGAFSLTAYKAALRAAFFERMGGPLAWKLFLTFLLVNLAAYIAFGIGLRVVRAVDGGTPPGRRPARLFLRRLRSSILIALVLVAMITWVALGLGAAAVAPTAGSDSIPPGSLPAEESHHEPLRRRARRQPVRGREDEEEQPLHHRSAVLRRVLLRADRSRARTPSGSDKGVP
jgi:hypothetical protein